MNSDGPSQESAESLDFLFQHHDDASLSKAVRNNPFPAWLCDVDKLVIMEVNDAALKQYGFTRDEFLRLSTIDLRPVDQIQTFLRQAVQHPSSKVAPMTMIHNRKDGGRFTVHIRSRKTQFHGRAAEFVCAIPVSENETSAVLTIPEPISQTPKLIHSLLRFARLR